tara:strand:- start:489 stop:1325 length:837 start_codon:yes stop_codon:yes gene_type:complete
MIHRFLKTRVGRQIRQILEYKNFKLEDKHKGESCYIFGDGVSIQQYELDNFNDKIGIACNHFPFHKDFKKTNVKYAILSEPFYFMPFFDSLIKKRKVETKFSFNPISFNYRKIVKENPGINFFINLSNYLFFKKPNIFYLYKDILSKRNNLNSLCKEFDCDKGVLRRAISLAVFLGFKKIYLVGCDYLMIPSRYGHWYEKVSGYRDSKVDESYIDGFIKRLKQNNINFKLVVPERVKSDIDIITYEELFKTKTNFKKNDLLLSEENFKVFKMQNTMKL